MTPKFLRFLICVGAATLTGIAVIALLALLPAEGGGARLLAVPAELSWKLAEILGLRGVAQYCFTGALPTFFLATVYFLAVEEFRQRRDRPQNPD